MVLEKINNNLYWSDVLRSEGFDSKHAAEKKVAELEKQEFLTVAEENLLAKLRTILGKFVN